MESAMMGFQCLQSEGQCVPVTTITYDQNFPLHDTYGQCARQCGDVFGTDGRYNDTYGNQYGYADRYRGGDNNTGPKKAPK